MRSVLMTSYLFHGDSNIKFIEQNNYEMTGAPGKDLIPKPLNAGLSEWTTSLVMHSKFQGIRNLHVSI